MNDKIQEIYETLGQSVFDMDLPEDWTAFHMHMIMIGEHGQARAELELKSGETKGSSTPRGASSQLLELKYQMAAAGMGAWISTVMSVHREPPRISFNHNFDEPVTWGREERPENYLAELMEFPRPPEQIPAWWPKEIDHPDWQKGLEMG